MGFHGVRFFRFRNLVDSAVDLSDHDVFLVGENGQGKTNVLEALYVLSYGAGFRSRRDRDLCRDRSGDMALDATYEDRSGLRDIAVRYQDGRKSIVVNGQPIVDRRDLIAGVPTVLFRHDDIQIATGPPENHRWFVDQTASFESPTHVDDLRRYRRVVRSRNEALRVGADELLDVYDDQLAAHGSLIQAARRRIVTEFSEVFEAEYHEISGLSGPLTVAYRPSWGERAAPEEITEHLRSHRTRDLAMRTTTSGPHRDRVVFHHRGGDFVETASTGQIRLVALVLRVAQARFVETVLGRVPVQLLDDVLLELDPVRRERFLTRLPSGGQRVFTFLPGEPYESYRARDTLVYSVVDGTLQRNSGG